MVTIVQFKMIYSSFPPLFDNMAVIPKRVCKHHIWFSYYKNSRYVVHWPLLQTSVLLHHGRNLEDHVVHIRRYDGGLPGPKPDIATIPGGNLIKILLRFLLRFLTGSNLTS